ncbi:MAG: nitroreductase family protein [Bacteroidota bacterium]
MADQHAFIAYAAAQYPESEMLERSQEFHHFMDQRRSLRDFSDRPVPQALMEHLIMTASTAPSGAHKQPWTFCLVGDPAIKTEIRKAAEKEEYESYHNRMTEEWLEDLAPIGTDWNKPFLETAPWLVVCFKRAYEWVDGEKRKNYYVNDSVGLACGFFLAAVHQAGLVALTHTPSPMDFLKKILQRPDNERPFLLMPVGYPAEGAQVPDLKRKPLDEVMVKY